MKLIATRAFGYGGVQLEPEQKFEASEPHAKALVALQKARLDTTPDKPARAAKAAEKAVEPAHDEAGETKRAYHRRDMKAQ